MTFHFDITHRNVLYDSPFGTLHCIMITILAGEKNLRIGENKNGAKLMVSNNPRQGVNAA